MKNLAKLACLTFIAFQSCTESHVEGIEPNLNQENLKTKSQSNKSETSGNALWYSFGFDIKGNAGCPRTPGNCLMPPVVIRPSSLTIINGIFNTIATGNQVNIQTEFQNHSNILLDHIPQETITEVSLGNLFVSSAENTEENIKFMLFYEDLNSDSILEVPFAYDE